MEYHKTHINSVYYDGNELVDQQRVEERFAWLAAVTKEPNTKIHKQEGKFKLEQIIHSIEQGGFAIVLVEASKLTCQLSECQSRVISEKIDEYCGHYILVLGVSLSCRCLNYFDPSVVNQHSCQISFDEFESARSANGTDEDCIIVQASMK
jgi:hypothetical protein